MMDSAPASAYHTASSSPSTAPSRLRSKAFQRLQQEPRLNTQQRPISFMSTDSGGYDSPVFTTPQTSMRRKRNTAPAYPKTSMDSQDTFMVGDATANRYLENPAFDEILLRSTGEQYVDGSDWEQSGQPVGTPHAPQQKAIGAFSSRSWESIQKCCAPHKQGRLQLFHQEDGSWKDVKASLYTTTLALFQENRSQRAGHAAARAAMAAGGEGQVLRSVVIHKDATEALGLVIQGGAEFGAPVVCASVDDDAPADVAMQLAVGDEILEVNGRSLELATQQEASAILATQRNATTVHFQVRFNQDVFRRLQGEELRSATADTQLAPGRTDTHLAPGRRMQRIAEIPLALCRVEAKHGLQGAFEIHTTAEDTPRSVTLRARFGDNNILHEWIAAIKHQRRALPCPPLAKGNPPKGFSGIVHWLGWVRQKGGARPASQRHRRKANKDDVHFLLAVTDYDISFYDALPRSQAAVDAPVSAFPLLSCRYTTLSAAGDDGTDQDLLYGNADGIEREFSLTLRNGTQYFFSCDTETTLQHVVEQRMDQAVHTTKTVSFPAYYRDAPATLTIDWQHGLRLHHDSRDNKTLIIDCPFGLLGGTASETAIKTLIVRFKPGYHRVPEERIQTENVADVVFALYQFLGAYVRAQRVLERFQ
eukprot:m.1068857 g.1068857  ORF g.1068857 m.1068857 type:complete len:648 (+) comp24229_c0_seq1:461-2404(+)